MGTRVKGILKGLKQLSHKFDDKDQEMQIGLPTDVKHVAHIGWDGPSLESPSWMNQFKGGGSAQSAPLDYSTPPEDNSEKKWVSQDSTRKKSMKSPARDLPELPKSSRRQSSESPAASPTRRRDPSKSRSSRRHLRKESDESYRGSRRTKEPSSDAPDQADIPKKTRRKKSSSVHRSSRSKDKDKESSVNSTSQDSLPSSSFSDPFSEHGLESIDSITGSPANELLPASNLKPFVPEVEKANVAVA